MVSSVVVVSVLIRDSLLWVVAASASGVISDSFADMSVKGWTDRGMDVYYGTLPLVNNTERERASYSFVAFGLSLIGVLAHLPRVLLRSALVIVPGCANGTTTALDYGIGFKWVQ